MVGEALLARSAEFEGLISIRWDKDVHGSFGLAFLLLLAGPSVPPPKKNLKPSRQHLRPRSSRVCTIVEEVQSDFGIQFGLEDPSPRLVDVLL